LGFKESPVEPVEYENMFRVEDTHWWYCALRRVLFHHLGRFLPGWRDAAVLDGGCGTGANLACLGAHRANHIGLDKAPQALGFCMQRGITNLVQGDVTALPFRCQAFAAVLSASVLYHRGVPDVARAIEECRRVLSAGGLLFLDLPAYNFLASAHDEAVHTARRFTRREVCNLLRAHGFRVRRISYWNTLLFPLIWLLRWTGISSTGRDFGGGTKPSGLLNSLLDFVMRLEFLLFRQVCLPFGVSISCVAVKDDEAIDSLGRRPVTESAAGHTAVHSGISDRR
jgi:SAM-dependent methyltransferase